MNKTYLEKGMYCKAQNQNTGEWITGTYIGRGLFIFPTDEPEGIEDESGAWVSPVREDTICRATGRENEFEYDVVMVTGEEYKTENGENKVFIIVYDEQTMGWALQLLFVKTENGNKGVFNWLEDRQYITSLSNLHPSRIIKLGSVKEDKYWKEEWERCVEER